MKLPNDTIIAEAKLTQYLLKFLVEDDTAFPAVMKHGRDTAMPCPYGD
jgi:hypothetical protein